MGDLHDEILERLRFESELAGPLVPADRTRRDPVQKGIGTPPPDAMQPDERSGAAARSESEIVVTKPEPSRSHRSKKQSAAGGAIIDDAYARIESLIPRDSPLHGFTTLADVESWVAGTHLIDLDKVRKNPVFGVGNPDADLMVIGEAPGANEDEQGEPFVGRAGQLLTDILAAIKFARSDVYIANILKSRPPNNRNPTADEIAAHIPILHKQITLIRPKILLCVGKVAGNSLLGNTASLSSLRGTFQDYHGLPVLVTFHPAALLRNPNWKRPTWEDVQLLRKRHDELVAASAQPDTH